MRDPPTTNATTRTRLRIRANGLVQGVGFRPHVYRLATELELAGRIANDAQGVQIEVEGERSDIDQFLIRLHGEKPPHSSIDFIETRELPPTGESEFKILSSDESGPKRALVLPDLATCPACLEELFDPKDPRYRYPFINCTHCGPRFSIVQAIPYDRPNTTMRQFELCPDCRDEYESPANRRFHAQPTACPKCGPQLAFLRSGARAIADGESALLLAEESIRAGEIVAIKGIGGFQLIVDAANASAVNRLRLRKNRAAKPFALMCPSIEYIECFCHVSERERELLESSAAPITLLRKKSERFPGVAPNVPDYGVMLPYSPLHHLLMRDLNRALVATSGNRSDEPICIADDEAERRLNGIADCFLTHNRPIARPVDDSIARVLLDRTQVLRRARGFAPLPIRLPREIEPCLALGSHLKNTVSVARGDLVFTSQHIGDLETDEAYRVFQDALRDLPELYQIEPDLVVSDSHPTYLSSRHATRFGVPIRQIQHHEAHAYACIVDNDIPLPVLSFCWDGAGWGELNRIWGAETFVVNDDGAKRAASIREFPLIGGDTAAREPNRVAFALLKESFPQGQEGLASLPLLAELPESRKAIFHQIAELSATPRCSSMGRLFDGVSSLLGFCDYNSYEGQAALQLEAAALRSASVDSPLPFEIGHAFHDGSISFRSLDWRHAIRFLALSRIEGVDTAQLALRFHLMLVDWIVAISRHHQIKSVALTGGCFQNRLLCELAATALSTEGFRPFFHQNIPPNDGGISVGQIAAVAFQNSAY